MDSTIYKGFVDRRSGWASLQSNALDRGFKFALLNALQLEQNTKLYRFYSKIRSCGFARHGRSRCNVPRLRSGADSRSLAILRFCLVYGHYSHMEKATISKLKDNLSAYLRKVRAGHPVVIYDRNVPIARLERIESAGSSSDRLTLLRAQGLTRPPTRPLSPARLRAALAHSLPRNSRLLEALQAERDQGR